MEDYEKKYKEICKWIESIYPELTHEHQMQVEGFLPELKESKDEIIRKELIEHVKDQQSSFISAPDCRDKSEEEENERYNSWLAWLEKQKEQVELNNIYVRGMVDKYRCTDEYDEAGNYKGKPVNCMIRAYEQGIRDVLRLGLKLEKQGEQKPVDKVEPKFKVGDWIIDKQGIVHQIERVVENVTNHTFGYDVVEGGYFNDSIEGVHLWTIEDAKDGDVICLYCNSNNMKYIFIFKDLVHGDVSSYCFWHSAYPYIEEEFNQGCHRLHELSDGGCFVPADKEEREILFQKMKEAGYEWDAEKKELKKIEQKPVELTERDAEKASEEYRKRRENCGVKDPVMLNEIEEAYYEGAISRLPAEWSEEDEEMVDKIIRDLKMLGGDINIKPYYKPEVDWLKSLKDRVAPQTKQEWSREDELNYKQAIYVCHQHGYTGVENWLKSLKPRWKPSEEQIKALDFAIDCTVYPEFQDKMAILEELLEQLKNL